ncbi:hypothetical protein QUA82_30115 [Microcoleus sp. F8-D3]
MIAKPYQCNLILLIARRPPGNADPEAVPLIYHAGDRSIDKCDSVVQDRSNRMYGPRFRNRVFRENTLLQPLIPIKNPVSLVCAFSGLRDNPTTRGSDSPTGV